MDYLKQTYPLNLNVRFKIRTIILGGLFVLLFFSLFQPFYLSTYDFQTKVIVIGAFVLITIIVLSFNLFVFTKIFTKLFLKEQWKVYKEIIWITYNIYVIAFGFFLFKIFYGFYEFTVDRILTGTLATIAIGFIPVSIYVLIRQFFILRSDVKTLEQKRKINLINEKNQFKNYLSEKEIVLVSERNDKNIQFKINDLYYVESEKNYVNLVFQIEDNIKKVQLRNRMKYVDEVLTSNETLVRCHRAFIVNLYFVDKLIKENNAYKLSMKKDDTLIPVSKTYYKTILSLLS